MRCGFITSSGHAIRRMFERQIAKDAVVSAIHSGEVIESYPDDEPYPSYLMLGFVGETPIHVLAGFDVESSAAIVVTVYVPDPALWSEDFRKRIRK